MAYKFNGGYGAIICDHCRIIFDAGISFREYEDIYGKDGSDGDYCWKCKSGFKEKGGMVESQTR